MKLDPRAKSYFFAKSSLFFIVTMPFWLISSCSAVLLKAYGHDARTQLPLGTPGSFMHYLIDVGLFVVVVFWFLHYVAKHTYDSYNYDIAEDGIHLQKGWLSRSSEFIPYGKIQDVTVRSGLISRHFGLAIFVIQNAVISQDTTFSGAVLPGIDILKAEELRQQILDHMKHFKSSGLD